MGLVQNPIDINKFVFDIDSLSNYTFLQKRKKIHRRKKIL